MACRAPLRPQVCPICIAAAVIGLGLIDLYMTMFHASTFGFTESNPLASLLLDASGTAGIMALKAASVTVCLCVLAILWYKHPKAAENLGWVLFLVMAALTAYWSYYTLDLLHQIAVYNVVAIDDLQRYMVHVTQ